MSTAAAAEEDEEEEENAVARDGGFECRSILLLISYSLGNNNNTKSNKHKKVKKIENSKTQIFIK